MMGLTVHTKVRTLLAERVVMETLPQRCETSGKKYSYVEVAVKPKQIFDVAFSWGFTPMAATLHSSVSAGPHLFISTLG